MAQQGLAILPEPSPKPSFVISIQSQVAYGHVGNSAGVLPMQLAGINVATVPTTILSNHPGFPSFYGRVLDAELVADLLRGVVERGVIERSFAIVSGYLGSGAIGDVIAEFVEQARSINPAIRYICDPVMGDVHTGTYVSDDAVAVIRDRLAPLADVLTPNQYELGLLSGSVLNSFTHVERAARAFQDQLGRQIVVTSCILDDTPADHLENIVFDAGGVTRLAIRRQPITLQGTGDLFTGTLAAELLHGRPLVDATRHAAKVVGDVAARVLAMGGEKEMQLGSVIDVLIADQQRG